MTIMEKKIANKFSIHSRGDALDKIMGAVENQLLKMFLDAKYVILIIVCRSSKNI